MGVASYRRRMEGVQRKMLLRVASGYRTISTKAIQVVTGIPPIHLLVKERRILYDSDMGHTAAEIRRAARETIMEIWQGEWEDNINVGQWTKRLIPRVQPWAECKHKRMSYYTTQALTGHGSFGSYTKKIKKTIEDNCLYCEEPDTPEHTIFQCTRWERVRIEAEHKIGEAVTPDNITTIMCKTKTNWDILQRMLNQIMEQKEKEERNRQERGNDMTDSPNS